LALIQPRKCNISRYTAAPAVARPSRLKDG